MQTQIKMEEREEEKKKRTPVIDVECEVLSVQ